MCTRHTYICFAVFVALMFFVGCKKRDRSSASTQPNQVAKVDTVQPPWEPDIDADCQPLQYPRIFVLTSGKTGVRYRHINGSSEDKSEFHPGAKYDVMTTTIPGVAGDRIDVLKHHDLRSDTLVITDTDSLVLTVGFMGSWFEELIDHYLVVSISTGPGVNPMQIYDLRTGKKTCTVYCDTPRSWDGYLMTAWFPSDSVVTDENCPEAKKWRSDGTNVGMEEQRELDIRTCQKRGLGQFRCVPYE